MLSIDIDGQLYNLNPRAAGQHHIVESLGLGLRPSGPAILPESIIRSST